MFDSNLHFFVIRGVLYIPCIEFGRRSWMAFAALSVLALNPGYDVFLDVSALFEHTYYVWLKCWLRVFESGAIVAQMFGSIIA